MGRSLRFAKRRNRTLTSRRDSQARPRVDELEPRTLLSAYTPMQIRHAYGVDRITFQNGAVRGDGRGQTIAIVNAYHAPTIQSDLAAFSRRYGLPQLDGVNGHGTFTVIDLSGGKRSPSDDGWTLETALDVEWAHAIAPKANILLVEAASDKQDQITGEPTDLLAAVHVAATTPGVVAVSMSWGTDESRYETAWDSFFTTPGVTFLAASGDSGAGTLWPAVSPHVVSVGGTTLRLTLSNTIAREAGWGSGFASSTYGGSGGGFSRYESLPSYQTGAGISASYTHYGVRLNPDIAYDANPNTGYMVLDSADGGWIHLGGTSAGAPQWAALVAIADQGRALNGLPALSSAQTLSALYQTPTALRDITAGSGTGADYVYDRSGNIVGRITTNPGPGYDLVTGLGTPAAKLLMPALVRLTAAGDRPAAPTTPSASGTFYSPGPQVRTALGDEDRRVPSSPFAAQIGFALPTPFAPQPAPLPSLSVPARAAKTFARQVLIGSPFDALNRSPIFAGGGDDAARSADALAPSDDGGFAPTENVSAPVGSDGQSLNDD